MVWVFSLFTTDVSTRRVSPELFHAVFGVCIGLVELSRPPSRHSALPPKRNPQGTTSIAFEENQLSPSLISLSLLSTTHRRTIATVVRSDLQPVLPGLHPGHG